MQNYFDYVKERRGFEGVDLSFGWFTYSISKLECYLVDFFISKEFRGQKKTKELLSAVLNIAKNNECEVLSATVDLRDPGANHTIAIALHCGFQMKAANADVIVIVKQVKED